MVGGISPEVDSYKNQWTVMIPYYQYLVEYDQSIGCVTSSKSSMHLDL